MADDFYSLYMEEDDAPAAERAKALADAIRGRRNVGNLGMITGDKVLSGFGQAQLKAAGQGEEMLGQAGRTRMEVGMRRKGLMAELEARQAKAAADKTKQGFDAMEGLRKEYLGNQVVKDTQQVASAYAKIAQAAKSQSAASDISMVYGFMKMQDPGSTVREGEYATAENAGGVSGQIMNLYNKVLKGERLPPGVRADFLNQAGGLYEAQLGRHDSFAGAFRGLAERAGGSPEDVVLDLGFRKPKRDKSAKGAAPAGGGRQVVKDKTGKVLGYINADGTEELVK